MRGYWVRLFIAVCLKPEVRNALSETIANLRAVAKRGQYTPWDNLHLTLVFIGDSERVDLISDVMNTVALTRFAEPLAIKLTSAGAFANRHTNSHWVGVENTTELDNLVAALTKALRNAGFQIDTRRYVPHITIARNVELKDNAVVRVHPASMAADRISLMRSDRIDNRQIYSEIVSVPCNLMRYENLPVSIPVENKGADSFSPAKW
jgi:2'-5' RNA ligase